MEKQIIVISYTGDEPTLNALGAALGAMRRFGVRMDATVQPTMCCLNEKEQAVAMAAYASRTIPSKKSVSIEIERPDMEDKAKKLAEAIKRIMLDE